MDGVSDIPYGIVCFSYQTNAFRPIWDNLFRLSSRFGPGLYIFHPIWISLRKCTLFAMILMILIIFLANCILFGASLGRVGGFEDDIFVLPNDNLTHHCALAAGKWRGAHPHRGPPWWGTRDRRWGRPRKGRNQNWNFASRFPYRCRHRKDITLPRVCTPPVGSMVGYGVPPYNARGEVLLLLNFLGALFKHIK